MTSVKIALGRGEIAIALYAADIPTPETYPEAGALAALQEQGVARLGGAERVQALTREMRRWDHLVLDGLLTPDEHSVLVRHRWPDMDRFDWCFGLADLIEPGGLMS